MPFDINKFNTVLLEDNPTIGRYIRSDLHSVINLLRSGNYTTQHLATEMRKVSRSKWQKYNKTRDYLIAQFPRFLDLLRTGTVIGFKTSTLKKHMIGVEHHFMCISDTGNVMDLEGIVIREHVSWNTPSPAIAPLMVNDPHYKSPNAHYGIAPGRADWPIPHQDVHGARAPFDGAKCKEYNGGLLTLTFDQVYEFSTDKKIWHPIPHSQFTLVRTLTKVNNKACIIMKKTHLTRPEETVTSDPLFFD